MKMNNPNNSEQNETQIHTYTYTRVQIIKHMDDNEDVITKTEKNGFEKHS